MNSYFYTSPSLDERGEFVKTYAISTAKFECRESFCTLSRKGVARGLHYQYSKELGKGADRVMVVLSGKIQDFLVSFDPLTRQCIDIQSNILAPGHEFNSVRIAGNGCCCHGFIALESSLCMYNSSQEYIPDADLGFDLFSTDYDFTSLLKQYNIDVLTRSVRDQAFPALIK